MKAVVMAGGEGTRLRPLTSNQPKPMVPIVGKPCMEHILDLLRRHGFDDVVVTLAFMPQIIRGYFGDGEGHGRPDPLLRRGDAGRHGGLGEDGRGGARRDVPRHLRGRALRHRPDRPRRASTRRGGARHDRAEERGQPARVRDRRHRLRGPHRALPREAVLGAGLHRHDQHRHLRDRARGARGRARPTARTTSRRSSSRSSSRRDGRSTATSPRATGRTSGTSTSTGRRTSTRSTAPCELEIPGIRLRGNVWVGEGVELDDVDVGRGPGVHRELLPDPPGRDGRRVLGARVERRRCASTRAPPARSSTPSTYIASGAIVEGAIVGRMCDIRAHARIQRGRGDRRPDDDRRRGGRHCRASASTRSRRSRPARRSTATSSGRRRRPRRSSAGSGSAGSSNVDLTPETALRLGTGARDGAQARRPRGDEPRGARRVPARAARSSSPGSARRASTSPTSRVMPAAVNRHLLKSEGFEAGVHVGRSANDPEAVEIQIYEPPGVQASTGFREGDREALLPPGVPARGLGRGGRDPLPGPRRRELRAGPAPDARRRARSAARGFRIVVDYGYSAASLVLPLVLGPLERRGRSRRAPYMRERGAGSPESTAIAQSHREHASGSSPRSAPISASRSTRARSGSSSWTSRRAAVPPEQALLLFERLLGSNGRRGKLAFPVTVTSLVERLAEGTGLEVERTPASLERSRAPRRATASSSRARRRAASSSRSSCPATTASRASASSSSSSPRSTGRSRRSWTSCRSPHVVHRADPLPVGAQGSRHARPDRADEGPKVDTLDGLKVFENGGWAQVLPDPAEPLVHVYAEGGERRGGGRARGRVRRARGGDRRGRRRLIRAGRWPQTLKSRLKDAVPHGLLESSLAWRYAWNRSPI